MASADKVYDFLPAMCADGITSASPYWLFTLACQPVVHAVSGAAAVFDLMTLADGNAYDGSGSFEDLTKNGEMWVVLEAQGADVFYRCRSDNAHSITATTQGEKIADGDKIRFKFTKAMRYVETYASGSGSLKSRFSNTATI